jgi:hypothetical protein
MTNSDEQDEKHQIALIHFERESAAKTAALLSNGNSMVFGNYFGDWGKRVHV